MWDDGATDPAESAALLELFRSLGGDVEELTEPHDLVAAISVLALRPPGARHSFSEAAARAGISIELARRIWAGLGLGSGERDLSEGDVAALSVAGATAELIGEDGVVEFSRVAGLAARRLAEALASLVRVRFEVPAYREGQSRVALAHTYFELIGERIPDVSTVVEAALRHHLSDVVHVAWRPDTSETVAVRQVAVGFADLVGFTNWTASATLAELSDALDAFDATVWEAAERSGMEVVKLIGDEVMFAAPTVDQALDGAQVLLESAAAQSSIEAVRVGISSGDAISRSGDLFGTVVIEAARLVSAAEPGTVLVSASAAATSQSRRFGETGAIEAKGFTEPIPARRLLT